MAGKTLQLIKNEQAKLRATFWNNLAVATVAAGIFIPFYAVSRDPNVFFAPVNFVSSWPAILVGACAFVLGGAMRAYASLRLTDMNDA